MVLPGKICGEHFANRKEHPMKQRFSKRTRLVSALLTLAKPVQSSHPSKASFSPLNINKQSFNRSVYIVERGKSKSNGRSTSPSKRDKKTSEWVNSAKKGSDIEAQLHVRTHLFHKLFFGVASPGVFRATNFLMVKVIHNDRVPGLCSSVGQLVVHEGTAVFL